MEYDATKHADLVTKEAAVKAAFEASSETLNTLKESDDPDNYQVKFSTEQLVHGQKERELRVVRDELARFEAVKPMTKEEQAAAKESPVRRWLRKGEQGLEQWEKDKFLGETDGSMVAQLGGAGGIVFNVPGQHRDSGLWAATDSTGITRSDDDTGTTLGSAGLATQDITLPDPIERLAYYGDLLMCCHQIFTSHGNKVTQPQLDGKDDEGVYFGAAPQKRTGTDLIGDRPLPPVTDVEWNAFVCNSRRLPIRLENFDDLTFDVEGRAMDHGYRRMSRVMNRKFTVGTGVNEPKGIMVTAEDGGTSELSGTYTYQDMVEIEFAVDLAYLRGNEGSGRGFNDQAMGNGRTGYMIHRNVEKIWRGMRDGDGRPLWVPSVREGAPNMFAGWPYWLNLHMDDVAADQYPMLFGSMGHFAVRQVNDVAVFRFQDSRTMENYSIEIMMFARNDSNTRGPLDNTLAANSNAIAAKGTVCEAYKKLKIKA